MGYIVIEGTETPSTLLGTGERRRISRSAMVDKLVAKGFVRIVSEEPEPEPAATTVEPYEVPSRNAKREVWAAFLDDRGITYLGDDKRDELIERWELGAQADGVDG